MNHDAFDACSGNNEAASKTEIVKPIPVPALAVGKLPIPQKVNTVTTTNPSTSKSVAIQKMMAARAAAKSGLSTAKPIAIPAGIKPVSAIAVKPANTMNKPVKPVPANTSPIGNFATPGTLLAKDFLDIIQTFQYGADFAPHVNQDSAFISEAINKLQAVSKPEVKISELRNHERVRVAVDAYIGCHIGQPLGPQLYVARDLANATVNPNGGWVPAMTRDRLKEFVSAPIAWVSKLANEEYKKDVLDSYGRINAAIGPDGDAFIAAREGNKFQAAVDLVNAIKHSLYLASKNDPRVKIFNDEDYFSNLAVNICGFTEAQAAVIFRTGCLAITSADKHSLMNDMRSQLTSLGPCPEVKPKKSGFSAKLSEILSANGLDSLLAD